MKNDPHVTEVSDDGALLRRYRNEIDDLKRRLNEASLTVLLRPYSLAMQPAALLKGQFEQILIFRYKSLRNIIACKTLFLCTSPLGFFSHTNNRDREGESIPAFTREGSAPKRTRGQD